MDSLQGAVVVLIQGPNGEFLFTSEHGKHQWSFPEGRMRQGEGPEETVARVVNRSVLASQIKQLNYVTYSQHGKSLMQIYHVQVEKWAWSNGQHEGILVHRMIEDLGLDGWKITPPPKLDNRHRKFLEDMLDAFSKGKGMDEGRKYKPYSF